MILSYENVLAFEKSIKNEFYSLSSAIESEKQRKEQMKMQMSKLQTEISGLRETTEKLKDETKSTIGVEETERYLEREWKKCAEYNKVEEYIDGAYSLNHIYRAVRDNGNYLKEQQKTMSEILNKIKTHKNYEKWVTKSNKANIPWSENTLTDLTSYSFQTIDKIIKDSRWMLFMSSAKRYKIVQFYILYAQECQKAEVRTKQIEYFDKINNVSKELIYRWSKCLESEVQAKEEQLKAMNTVYIGFEQDSKQRLGNTVLKLQENINKLFSKEVWNGWYEKVKSEFKYWDVVNSKSDIMVEEKEDFLLLYCGKKFDVDIMGNSYAIDLAKRLEKDYPNTIKMTDSTLIMKFPLQMHLDTLKYRFAFDISECDDRRRGDVNGVAQAIVTSVIANMPVGKAKLIFSDPGNTGVFSNFRDVGKNETEGSRLTTYIVDADGINRELIRISNEIGYAINNILKGTRTTLFQHNKVRAFNSSPYIFLFLMDYPNNMTTQSLQALKNIVENGPKCGIFTFIFNSAGTYLQLLRPEERELAEQIAISNFRFENGIFIDENGWILDSYNEISTNHFDEYVRYYNEAIKDNKQLIVYLDDIEGEINENGEYKIPIGKNLGGEVEYMSFFGSCQDYMMSGATRIGKTNALHVIIYNTLKYVPNAELYLVDFKQGVEFAPYASLNHPVIKALAVESVPEFGYAVLKHIEEKIKAISELFISCSVKNWKEYYETTGKVIPVTIVIMDEFQHLFDTEVGKDCARIIEVIAKEGGAFNVHIILATQSVSTVQGLTEAAKDNIFGRMVFYHTEREYNTMLWNDTNLALTLNAEIKGQMVYATGDNNSQRLLQWALAKPIQEVVSELSYSMENGRYPTKLLLSTVRENPFSVFNAVIKGVYKISEDDKCDITIGNEVDVFAGELRGQIEAGNARPTEGVFERSYVQLAKKPNENILFVGNNESAAEASFQLAIYCVLIRAIYLGKRNSIVVLAPELAMKLSKIAADFSDYIELYNQESDLTEINLSGKEFFFVFGLQNFRSLSYQADTRTVIERTEGSNRTPGIFMHQMPMNNYRTDGQLFQEAVLSKEVHVIAWHNSVQNLASMFGGNAKVQDFLYCFLHKVGFKMQDKNDSKMFVNSEICSEISEQAAVYVKMNRERVIRPYKAIDRNYCDQLDKALKKLEKEC